jgi:hypothetical protein
VHCDAEPNEREITTPVDLCAADGRLNPDAIGWSRRPLQRANLRGRALRKKRWNYWAVTSPTHLFSATISNLDYAGVVFVYLADFAARTVLEQTVVTPLGWGCALPEAVAQSAAFRSRRLRVELAQDDGGGVRIGVRSPGFAGRGLEAELEVLYPAGHETLSVVVPWNARTFQLTSKHSALPACGTVRLGGDEIRFAVESSFACLDFGRGVWPRDCLWNWGSAAGHAAGRTVGLNLGGRWTDGSGATENALCIDGRLHKIGAELRWDYDRSDFLRPWRIATAHGGRVDLRFTPLLERVARSRVGPIRSAVHQVFGRYEGVMLADDGSPVAVRELLGWAEEHVARW